MFAFSHNPARLNGPYDLFFTQRVKIVEDYGELGTWRVTTLSYMYAIERHKDRQEIVSFHWDGHDAENPVPHIHLGFAALEGAKSSPIGPKNHIPGGRVLVEDIVKFLIDEMGVRPMKKRQSDWRSILAEIRGKVMKWKTW